MKPHVAFFVFSSLAIFTLGAHAQDVPLFASEEPVSLKVIAPLKSLKKQRGDELEEMPGQVVVTANDGTERTLDIQIVARGNSRRQKNTCDMPPYWLNFKKNQVEGTIFEGQDKLKVVSHCRESRRPFDGYIYREYLTYKTYQLLTDKGFSVRLARIDYEDTESKYRKESQIGFFIEHNNGFEDRHGASQIKDQFVPPSHYNLKALCLAEVYQYFVNNLDFTFFSSLDECCHNGKVFDLDGEAGDYLPVPYDFDRSGLVNPPYAEPNPALKKIGVKRMTDRIYLGVEVPEEVFSEVMQLFLDKKAAIYELWENFEPLDDKNRVEALEFIDEFYGVLEDPNKLQSEIKDKMRNLVEARPDDPAQVGHGSSFSTVIF